MNCKSLCVASLAVALVLSNMAVRPARADLTQEQLTALAVDYISLMYELDSLKQSLDETNALIDRWQHSIKAMEASMAGLKSLLAWAYYDPLTEAEVDAIYAQISVLYIQIPRAQSELESLESQRDALEGQIIGTQVAMALIAQILAGY